MEYLFLAFHAFPGFSGWYPMLSKKPRNPGKLGIIPGFPRFSAHRGKSGKRGAFRPGFPGFPRLSQAFGSNIPGFPGDRGILESPESAESLGFPRFPGNPGKRGKPRVSALSWKAKRLLAFLAFPYVQKSVESQEFFRGIPGISWLFFAGAGPKRLSGLRETGPRAPCVYVISSTVTDIFYESIVWFSTDTPVLIFKNNVIIICTNNAFSYSSVTNNLQDKN